MAIERVPMKAEPRLMEALVQEMQGQLAAGVSWLGHVFGKAERTQRRVDGTKFYSPSVYVGGGKYERIEPDSRGWGNYAFFYLDGEEQVTRSSKPMPYYDLEGELSLVVWGDMRDIEREDDRNVESIKWMLLQVIGGMRLTKGRVTLEKVISGSREVWENYTLREETGEFMMWPYFAFRFVFTAECNTGCE